MHTRHGQGLADIDGFDFGTGIRRCNQGNVKHALKLNVSCKMTLAQHKPFVFYSAAMFANKAKWAFAHDHLPSAWVAYITASTICW